MSEEYDIESEMLIQAAETQHKIKSVSIRTIYGEETSQIHPIKDTLRFFALVAKYHFNRNGRRGKKKKDD